MPPRLSKIEDLDKTGLSPSVAPPPARKRGPAGLICRLESYPVGSSAAFRSSRHARAANTSNQQQPFDIALEYARIDDPRTSPSSAEPAPKQSKRSTEEANTSQHDAWRSAMPEFVHHAYSALSNHNAENAAKRQQLRDEFQQKLHSVVLSECPRCCTPDSLQLVADATSKLTYCSLLGSMQVGFPSLTCQSASCSASLGIHPVAVGCFPATPSRPSVWFSQELMVATAAIRAATPYAGSAWTTALLDMHEQNGFTTAKYTLRHLPRAAQFWQVMHNQVHDIERLGVRPVVDGGCSRCPCCYKTCVAASADACMGLRRFKHVAKASTSLMPMQQPTPFIAEQEVQAALQRRAVPAIIEPPKQHACASFKADEWLGRRVNHYDRLGVAAAICCGHCAANHLQASSLQLEHGIYSHYEWCHYEFNARYIPGAGLTFGDNVEHLWPDLRRHGFITAYMSPAARQDYLTQLVRSTWEHGYQGELENEVVCPARSIQSISRSFHIQPIQSKGSWWRHTFSQHSCSII